MEAEKVVQISPLIRRITAGNGSVFTGPGTNTYLVGNEDVTVIDPGPAMQDHIDAILASSKNIKQILVTHTHPDHSPGVRLLKNKLDIPAYGMLTNSTKNQDTTFSPERVLEDGELLEENEFSLEVVHTPGHASNHLCFILKEEKFIFTGDHIMSGSTVVIGPPDGNMNQYIKSLEKLKAQKAKKEQQIKLKTKKIKSLKLKKSTKKKPTKTKKLSRKKVIKKKSTRKKITKKR